MAACARSTICALHLLGNLVRGLDFFNWRKVYNAIVLPVLTFGSPVWSLHLPKSALQNLQIAQNDAIHRIGGLFRTTPTDAAHHIIAIPPIKHTLLKYRLAYQQRLTRIPPSSKPRQILSSDQTTYHHPQYFPPTTLRHLYPSSFPPFYLPTNTTWFHPHASCRTPEPTVVETMMSTQTMNTTDVMVYPIPHPTHKASAFLIFQDGIAVDRGFCLGPNKVDTAIGATIDAFHAVGRTAPSHICLFIHNKLAQHRLFSLQKHRYLLDASLFTAIASVLLMDDDSSLTTYSFSVRLPGKKSRSDPRIFSHSWPGPPQKNWNLAELRSLASEAHHTHPPPSHLNTPLSPHGEGTQHPSPSASGHMSNSKSPHPPPPQTLSWEP